MCIRCVMAAIVSLAGIDVFIIHCWPLESQAIHQNSVLATTTEDHPSILHHDSFKIQPSLHHTSAFVKLTLNASEYPLPLVHCKELQVPYMKVWLAIHCGLVHAFNPKRTIRDNVTSSLRPKKSAVFRDSRLINDNTFQYL